MFDFGYHGKYMHTHTQHTHARTHTLQHTCVHTCTQHTHTLQCSKHNYEHLYILFTGVSTADLQGRTHFISTDDDATKVLDCNTPEDPEDEVLLYEWIVDGVRVNSSASSLSVSHTGAYICYVHLKQQTLTTVHRVLPYGKCENSQKYVKRRI